MGVAVGEGLSNADTMLFGRVTYDSFAGAWPARETAGAEDAGFAKQLGDIGLIQGATLYALYRAADQVWWPASQPAA